MTKPASLSLLRFARHRGGADIRDIKARVREASAAPEDATIVVSELRCSEPGCPPYEVVMAVLLSGKPPLQRKLHVRLAELTNAQVQQVWQANDESGPHHHDNETDR